MIAPIVFSLPTAILFAGGSNYPIITFGIGALVGYIVTLAVVGCLFLPALWLVSRVVMIKMWLSLVVGGLLGALIFLAWDYTSLGSSGVDSGPPAMTYRNWIVKSWFSPEPLVVISVGLVTAAVYHLLATRKRNQSSDHSPALGRRG